MIKIEHIVLASPEQMEFVIEGMRNPLNSWDKSDSYMNYDVTWGEKTNSEIHIPYYRIGAADASLMRRLSNAGRDHRKFMRMIPVYARITAGHTWWAEFDTYKVGTVRNSCSKMHKIHIAGFERDEFDHEGVDEVGGQAVEAFEKVRETLIWLSKMFNETKKKKYWRAIIELLPMGFHLIANVEVNYEVLANIYHSRKNHKLDEWKTFCEWIESLPHSEIIIGERAA